MGRRNRQLVRLALVVALLLLAIPLASPARFRPSSFLPSRSFFTPSKASPSLSTTTSPPLSSSLSHRFSAPSLISNPLRPLHASLQFLRRRVLSPLLRCLKRWLRRARRRLPNLPRLPAFSRPTKKALVGAESSQADSVAVADPTASKAASAEGVSGSEESAAPLLETVPNPIVSPPLPPSATPSEPAPASAAEPQTDTADSNAFFNKLRGASDGDDAEEDYREEDESERLEGVAPSEEAKPPIPPPVAKDFDPKAFFKKVVASNAASTATAAPGAVLSNPDTARLKAALYSDDASPSGPKIIMFTAPWCGACKSLAPTLTALCASSGTPLVEFNVDVSKPLSKAMGVTALPTLLGVSGRGEVLYKQVGGPGGGRAGVQARLIDALTAPNSAEDDGARRERHSLANALRRFCFAGDGGEGGRLAGAVESAAERLLRSAGGDFAAPTFVARVGDLKQFVEGVCERPWDEEGGETFALSARRVADLVGPFEELKKFTRLLGFKGDGNDPETLRLGRDFDVRRFDVIKDVLARWIEEQGGVEHALREEDGRNKREREVEIRSNIESEASSDTPLSSNRIDDTKTSFTAKDKCTLNFTTRNGLQSTLVVDGGVRMWRLLNVFKERWDLAEGFDGLAAGDGPKGVLSAADEDEDDGALLDDLKATRMASMKKVVSVTVKGKGLAFSSADEAVLRKFIFETGLMPGADLNIIVEEKATTESNGGKVSFSVPFGTRKNSRGVAFNKMAKKDDLNDAEVVDEASDEGEIAGEENVDDMQEDDDDESKEEEEEEEGDEDEDEDEGEDEDEDEEEDEDEDEEEDEDEDDNEGEDDDQDEDDDSEDEDEDGDEEGEDEDNEGDSS